MAFGIIREVAFGITKHIPTYGSSSQDAVCCLLIAMSVEISIHERFIYVLSWGRVWIYLPCASSRYQLRRDCIQQWKRKTISTFWGCLGHLINMTELLKWILKEGLYPAVEKTRFYLYTLRLPGASYTYDWIVKMDTVGGIVPSSGKKILFIRGWTGRYSLPP